MEILNKIVLGIAVATIPSISFAQSEITGHIIDATTGEPLIGASVVVKGDKKKGVVTDADGNFTLNTQVEAPLKLKVEYIGYRPIDLEVYDTETPVEVKLRENLRFLNEVVVIGYGTQKRENVASSISSINNKTFKDVPVTSIDQVLQGRASGVSLTTPSGNVGQAPIVKIRGVASITSGTQPLYIVDGVPVQTGCNAQLGDVNALADADVKDIEELVRPCGLGKSKARDISACMRILWLEYGGKVPENFDALLKLPGVGRKSANLIMGDVFGKPAIVTDTHCIRLSNRIGLVDNIKDPRRVEMALWKIVPPEEGSDLCHRLVYHGREVCTARTAPYCERCCLKDICRTYTQGSEA